ncbi:hypothetical protein [Helicobacter sp. MIT 01-3238]|uniref:hypothetical protein n=1 Tax=Helicobacter sp. MIT 01-3238 TaxID=398627 RepID=UPI000E1F2A67|nr:hypothetical protein [Helicobacter sp. MIT 01-3238]RDU52911.1 hypothetical protein CQA40_06310 [Helicobacter sp. MIT 01-3238]
MKKLTLTLCLTLCVTMVVAITPREQDAFKNGFKTGLAMFEFQLQNEGVTVREAPFSVSDYVVYATTTKMPMAEILYLQFMANRDNFETLLTKDELVFGRFARQADAEDAVKQIAKNYNITAKIAKGQTFYVHPILAQKAYDMFIREARENGNLIYTDKLTKTRYVAQTSNNNQGFGSGVKSFRLKNALTQSYILQEENAVNSASFVEYKVIKGKMRYGKEKVIVTNEGEVFIKAKGKNLYFSSEDVEEDSK